MVNYDVVEIINSSKFQHQVITSFNCNLFFSLVIDHSFNKISILLGRGVQSYWCTPVTGMGVTSKSKHPTSMQKAMYAFVLSHNSSSSICAYIFFVNVIAIYVESFAIPTIQNTIILLGFNLMLSLSLILIRNTYQNPLYTSITNNNKGNEFEKLQVEFLKLTGNFCLITIISLISSKYAPLQSNLYSGIISSILCVLIMLRWNSKSFLKKSAGIFFSLFIFTLSEVDTFPEIVVADVWTSLSKASFLPLGFEFSWTRTTLFW